MPKKKEAKKKCLWDRIVGQPTGKFKLHSGTSAGWEHVHGHIEKGWPDGRLYLKQGNDDTLQLNKSQAEALRDKLIELLA